MAPQVRWKLSIVGPDGARRSVPLSRDLLVGREPDVDLLLNDSSVSRHHAKLMLDESGALWIEDLGSVNGVLIGDARIGEKTKLRSGVLLKLGLFDLTVERIVDATLDRTAAADRAPPRVNAPGAAPTLAAAAGDEKMPTQPVLRFRTGPLAGKDATLIRREITLGRIAEDNDIVVPDESVSRHHASFVRLGRGYAIRDLQSVNGTSVNGARVVLHSLRLGDRLRIGTVEADYLGPNAEKVRPVDRKLVKRVLLASGALLALVLVFELVQFYRVKRAEWLARQQPEAEDTGSFEKSLAAAQAARRDERWEPALAAYQAARAFDPVNDDARKGIKDVEIEMQMRQLFDRARQRVDIGQYEEGVELYLQISSGSIYYPRARAEVHRLADMLLRRFADQCQSAQRDGDVRGVAQSCGRYLNLVCNSHVDDAKLRLLRAAEKKLGAKNKEPRWVCPPTYARWFSEVSTNQATSVEQRIGTKYKNARVAEAVRIYANGQARAALVRLAAIKEAPADAHDPELIEALRQVELAYGAYMDGVSALETGDVRATQQHWKLFWDADKQIMPDGDQSALADQARTQLAKEFYRTGQQLFQQVRLADAYRVWEQGAAVQPGDNDLAQGFITLENTAAKYTTADSSCQDLALALQITRATSFNHKRAVQLGQDHKCSP